MSEEIDVKKVARLARLRLKTDEEIYFAEKFRSILEYVGSISQVEIDDPMTEQDELFRMISREDVHRTSPVSPEQFSGNVENKFFKVPKVIE